MTRTAPQAAQLGTEFHRALSDPSRVRILEALQEAEAPLDARELGTRVGLHWNTVRSHLRVLAEAGLVSAQREERNRPGRPRVLYEAAAEPLDSTRARQPSPPCAGPRQPPRWLRARPERSRRGGRTGMGRAPRPPAAAVCVDLEGGDDRRGRSSPRAVRLQSRAQASHEWAGDRAEALSLPGAGDDLPDRYLFGPSRSH